MMSSSRDEGTAMQVETDDFILSLTSVNPETDEQTEVITTEVSDLPPDLVNTDVSDLANNPSLWLGLEGALESNDAVSHMSNVSSIVDDHGQGSETVVHLGSDHHSLNMNDLGHSEEVETMSIEAMDVDVQNLEVNRSQSVQSIPMESFMDQSDIGFNIMTNNICDDKSKSSITPMSVSLPVTEPIARNVFPLSQIKKTVSASASTQVTKVVLAPTSQNQHGQPLLLTVPASTSGLTSLLTTNTNLRFVNALNTDGSKISSTGPQATGIQSQSVRLMSPTKTITLQQAQQLGLISPKKGQPLIVNKVAVAAGGQTTPANNILAGKQGAKFAGGNVTLVRSGPTKTPTKIAPAPPHSVASTVSSTSSIQSQPTSLLIKNAAGQVTMAALVQARPSGGSVTNMNPLSPQKFVLRPSTPGSVTSAQVRQSSGTQPAQYIRLTTAQALAAGILPAMGPQGEQSGTQQHFQLAGNKIQLVRVVNPTGGNNGTGNLITAPGTSKVLIGATTANSIKIHPSNSTVTQQSVKGTLPSVTKTLGQAKGAISTVSVPQGAQRIILPAGSMNSLTSNIVMVPAQYSSQNSMGTNSSPATTNFSAVTTSAATVVSESITSPIVTSSSATPRLSQQPKAAPPPSPESAQMSTAASQAKAQSVLESNGLKPRKPCNCTKSQCLKLYCDCFANGEFCHGCNCVCCANNLEHEELRLRAIRSCLDRNPHAFKPKIGVGWGPEPRRHNKGCHCKRSGCLKNYCECYEAKIACSAICKCIGCKNCVDPAGSPPGTGEKRTSKMAVLQHNPGNSNDSRTVSNTTHNSKQDDRSADTPKGFSIPSASGSSRPPFSFITQEVVEATCQCLLAQAEEAERLRKTSAETEGLVLEEFGRCLLQIIEYASKAKVSASP